MILRKALVFGSMNMDLSICCSRIPAAGETIDGDSFITNPGGKGANQAVAAARMGAPVIMVASVGDDTFGSVLVGCLEGADIDTSFVRVETNVPTGTATSSALTATTGSFLTMAPTTAAPLRTCAASSTRSASQAMSFSRSSSASLPPRPKLWPMPMGAVFSPW